VDAKTTPKSSIRSDGASTDRVEESSMRAKIAALVAAVATAASTAGAAAWARRRTSADSAKKATPKPAAAAPRPADAPAPAAPPSGSADDLTSLKGIGAVSAERLAEVGITTFAQLAAWSDEDIDEMGPRIRVSPERIRREDWVGQARAAAAG
jgi:predicted flap endonuclease-1-like 5' DNA nuclease